MSKKRIVMESGFLIVDKKIVPCHFKNITTADIWGDNSLEKLVLVDGIVSIIGNHKQSVFLREQDAVDRLSSIKKEALRRYQEQVDIYTKKLNDLKNLPFDHFLNEL